MSTEKVPRFACIRYGNEKRKVIIVNVNEVKMKFTPRSGKSIFLNFNPTSLTDFSRTTWYWYVHRSCSIACSEDHEHETYVKANVLILGGKYICF